MEKNIIKLEDCVILDVSLDNINRAIQKDPISKYPFIAWDEMIEETDAIWCRQSRSSLMRMVPFGRMRLNMMLERDDNASRGALSSIHKRLTEQASNAANRALNSQRGFDAVISYPSLESYEKNGQAFYAYTENSLAFNGWNLAHFERIYRAKCPAYQEWLNWDFVLGADGKIYHLTYGYTRYDQPTGEEDQHSKFFYNVREAIFYDLCLLSNKNQAYFIAVSHGALLTVNSILQNQDVADGKFRGIIRPNDNEEYIYNFPSAPPAGLKIDVYMWNLADKLTAL